MIVESVPGPLSLRAVMARAAGRRLPCAFRLAEGGTCDGMVFACDPVRVVRGDSVDALAAAWAEERAAWGNLSRVGQPVGAGWLSYDLGYRFERIRGQRLEPSPWPQLEFRFYDAFLAVAGARGVSTICARDGESARRLTAVLLSSGRDEELDVGLPAAESGPLDELEAPRVHLDAVARALEYIRAGDIYQVNLARRLGCAFQSRGGQTPAGALFLRLEEVAPAPHAFWMGDAEEGTALVGNSPERYLRLSPDGIVETSPIKGTRRRDPSCGNGRDADLLLASDKDRAEHVMIVDLERNDLGRVCRTGSVEVAELCRVLELPTVCHLESTVRGNLRAGIGLPGLLHATFPGGSITGAPKIRAMEIIEEIEPARRGPYTGATGWLGAAGDLDLAVAIRTALVRDDRLTLWVGGGIVADSTPQAELAETWDKARAFSRALG